MRRHRRGGPRLSLRQRAARRRPARLSRTASRLPASSTCRLSSMRATPTTTSRAILAQEMGQGRFSALLHCFTSSRATRRDRARPRALDLVFRRGDVQEIGGLARHRPRRAARPHSGRDRRALSRADAPSRPPQRAGLRRRHGGRGRRSARDHAGSAGRGDARQHPRSLSQAAAGCGKPPQAAGKPPQAPGSSH